MADKPLDQVYAANNSAELQNAYQAWSSDYDRETAADGYCLPFIIAAWVARYVPADSGPLLDAGCGTGLTGPYLRALGYSDIEGLDFSPDMLRVAQRRDAYASLVEAELGKKLPWRDGHFRAVYSTGVFTEGHAPASSLDELARITRIGGHVIVTVRCSILDSGGFGREFARLAQDGTWRMIEQSPPFRAFAVGEPDVLVSAFVYEISHAS
ncbi:methyltransferase domain-containing protein [Mesorhizobium sp. NBSH29]|uniref:class I SAM-dependent DNA methyltransferase n=1 Tax=Mesorhizobium sp. NBSH29 TaxID=2654249 RepID=UPI00189673BD|nr:class I SAM-dependent methyltransferase [Mesorhizobium sp. NBSH29]QPC86043.1 methyltransferase domain-containing protein [Mesorhizobium sp. NBSH29]